MIVMEGNVQVRVGKTRTNDYWLGNLRKGSCFNVYTPFENDRKGRVGYYANSQICHISYLPIDKLIKLCYAEPSLLSLIDILKMTKFKVKYNLLDDLDYFPFPAKWLDDDSEVLDSKQ